MTQFLHKIKAWLAKLAFWREPAAETTPPAEAEIEVEAVAEPKPSAAVDDAPSTVELPAGNRGWLARLKALFTRLKQWLSFRRKQVETEAEPDAEAITEKKPRRKTAEELEEPIAPEPKLSFFTRLKQRLSFRRKAVETEAEPDAEAVPKKKPRGKTTEESEEPAAPEPKLSFFTRLKQWLTFRRKAVEAEAEPEDEAVAKKKTRSDESAEIEAPAPKLGLLARLKQLLRFRRKAVATEDEADDKTQVIEKTKRGAETTDAEEAADAPPPSRLKRLLVRLRSKWVWIPAASLVVVGLISWVVVFMLHATHEKERLQTELKAAKKMLEQKQVAAKKPPVAPPKPAAPVAPEKKMDPAFSIVGHVPAAQSEEDAGINASDCVITDKKSVSENLKNCIADFNSAVASTPKNVK